MKKQAFVPTEDEAKMFDAQARGEVRRRIDPQPWNLNGDSSVFAWKRPDSAREFDVVWVKDSGADDMMDAYCPITKQGSTFHTTARGAKTRATDVRAVQTPTGWEWVVMWRQA